MDETKIRKDGRVTLPKEIRQAMGLMVGDRLGYLVGECGEITLVKLRTVKTEQQLRREKRHPTPSA